VGVARSGCVGPRPAGVHGLLTATPCNRHHGYHEAWRVTVVSQGAAVPPSAGAGRPGPNPTRVGSLYKSARIRRVSPRGLCCAPACRRLRGPHGRALPQASRHGKRRNYGDLSGRGRAPSRSLCRPAWGHHHPLGLAPRIFSNSLGEAGRVVLGSGLPTPPRLHTGALCYRPHSMTCIAWR
jgi:hypothetical protein